MNVEWSIPERRLSVEFERGERSVLAAIFLTASLAGAYHGAGKAIADFGTRHGCDMVRVTWQDKLRVYCRNTSLISGITLPGGEMMWFRTNSSRELYQHFKSIEGKLPKVAPDYDTSLTLG